MYYRNNDIAALYAMEEHRIGNYYEDDAWIDEDDCDRADDECDERRYGG